MFLLLGSAKVALVLYGYFSPRIRQLDTDLPDAVPGVISSEMTPEIPISVSLPRLSTAQEASQSGFQTSNFWAAFSMMGILVGSVVLGISSLQPPKALPVTAPLTVFSAERAKAHLKQIAQRPHPIGSKDHDRVRDYLIHELESLGLAPSVQRSSTVIKPANQQFWVGDTQNITACLPGIENTRAILLAGHYDSTPTGPGASDDGAAVASLLETVRALQANQPLKNDIIILFTDGEEVGLLGSEAFVTEHPLAKEVGLVLSFEARGTSGVSLMFETSGGSGKLIREFGQVSRQPVASSLFQEAYRLLPNLTDFSAFKAGGMKGLNFAYIDSSTNYHSEQDSLKNLDDRSLQHQGESALELTRRFGMLDLRALDGTDSVYFSFLNLGLVHYSQRWVLPLTGIVCILMAGVFALGFFRKHLTWSGIWKGFGLFLLNCFGLSVMVAFFWWVLRAIRVTNAIITWSDQYHSRYFLIGFALLAVTVTVSLYSHYRNRVNPFDMFAGVLLWWALLMVVTSFWAPGMSYVFTWPLFCCLVGWGMYLLPKTRDIKPAKILWVFSLAALPGLLLLVPLTYLLSIGLQLEFSCLLMVLFAMMFSFFIPHLVVMSFKSQRWLQIGAGVFSVVVIVLGCGLPAYNSDHKRPNSLFYAYNADSGKPVWASLDEEVDPWTSHFLKNTARIQPMPEFFPVFSPPFLQSEAPLLPLAPPVSEVLEDKTEGGIRLVRLRIKSQRQAPLMQCFIERSNGLQKWLLNGKPLDFVAQGNQPAGNWIELRYWAFPEQGAEFTLLLKPGSILTIRAIDHSYELPVFPHIPPISRPSDTMALPYGFGLTDRTLVGKTFRY